MIRSIANFFVGKKAVDTLARRIAPYSVDTVDTAMNAFAKTLDDLEKIKRRNLDAASAHADRASAALDASRAAEAEARRAHNVAGRIAAIIGDAETDSLAAA